MDVGGERKDQGGVLRGGKEGRFGRSKTEGEPSSKKRMVCIEEWIQEETKTNEANAWVDGQEEKLHACRKETEEWEEEDGDVPADLQTVVEKEKGNEAFRKRQFERAVDRYTKALDAAEKDDTQVENKSKWNATLRTNRAQAHLRLGQFPMAKMDCQQAVQAEPTHAKAWYHGAMACFRMEDFENAKTWFQKAMELQTEDSHTTQTMMERCQVEIDNQKAAQQVKETAAMHRSIHGKAMVGKRGVLESPSDLLVIEEGVRMLVDDEDEGDTMAADDTLELLESLLVKSVENRQYFAACSGYMAVMLYLNEAYCDIAYKTLRAASGAGQDGGIFWPHSFLARLVHLATSAGVPSRVLTVLLQLLELSSRDPLMRTGVLTSQQQSDDLDPPLKRILLTIRKCKFASVLSVTGARALVSLLRNFSTDSASRSALQMVDVSPLCFLVELYQQAEHLVGSFATSVGPSLKESDFESVEEFMAFAKREQQRLYDRPVVTLRKSILYTLALLSKDMQILQADMLARQTDRSGKSRTVAAGLVQDLYDTLQKLQQDSPLKTAPFLGMDGKPRSYEQRPYAADYLRNPTGDLLMQLDDGKDGSEDGLDNGDGEVARLTQLEHCLTWLSSCTGSKVVCQALLPKRILDLMEGFWMFATPSVVSMAKDVCARFCRQNEKAVHELLEQSNVTAASALLQLQDAQLVHRGLQAILLNLSTCPGDEFAEWCSGRGGLLQVIRFLGRNGLDHLVPSKELKHARIQKAAEDVFIRTLERARSCQSLPRAKCPQGGGWDKAGPALILELEAKILGLEVPRPAPKKVTERAAAGSRVHSDQRQQTPPSSKETPSTLHSKGQEQGDAHQTSKDRLVRKGFLGGRSRRSGRGIVQPSQAKHALDLKKVVKPIGPVHPQDGAIPAWLQDAEKPEGNKKETEGYDEDGLKVVYDSAPSLPEREKRKKWTDIPLKDKFRWTQTSVELVVYVKMPEGTRGKDVTVKLTPTRLTVNLGWYGKVLDGPLSRRCKASEFQWSLDGNEVTILIPKDDSYFWRSLFEGGEEKSHYEVLKELVHADEPTVPYDELDDDAKELLEELRERQELINEGLIDPEAFDDFRCVIGDGDGAK
eukprot:scaffold1671_cov344-Pavlova_lutheri.AAC.39